MVIKGLYTHTGISKGCKNRKERKQMVTDAKEGGREGERREGEKTEIINYLPMDNGGQIALKSSKKKVHIILNRSVRNSEQIPHTTVSSAKPKLTKTVVAQATV